MEDKLKTMRNESTTKIEKAKSAVMCWEPTSNLLKEETHGGITSFHGFPIFGEQLQTANHVLHVIWILKLPQYS